QRPPHTFRDDLIDLSWRAWTRVALGAAIGVGAGAFLAIHGSTLLADLGIFVYEPDDDDDDDAGKHEEKDKENGEGATGVTAAETAAAKATTHAAELTALFGDYRLNVAYNWSAPDATYITLSREKLTMAMAELDAITKALSGKMDQADLREASLARKFLQDSLDSLESRARVMGSTTLSDAAGGGDHGPPRRRFAGLRDKLGW
ncbi:hypothetical protein HKX48_002662, partial [Thoreauomyces humboldtii]